MASVRAQSVEESSIGKRVTRSSRKLVSFETGKAADREEEIIHTRTAKCTARNPLNCERPWKDAPLRGSQRLRKDDEASTAAVILKKLKVRCLRLDFKNNHPLAKNALSATDTTASPDEGNSVEKGDSTDITQQEKALCDSGQHREDINGTNATRKECSKDHIVGMILNNNDKIREIEDPIQNREEIFYGHRCVIQVNREREKNGNPRSAIATAPVSVSNASPMPTAEKASDKTSPPVATETNMILIEETNRLAETVESAVDSDVLIPIPSSIENRTEHSEVTLQQCHDPTKERLFIALCSFFRKSITNNCINHDNNFVVHELSENTTANQVTKGSKMPISYDRAELLNISPSGNLNTAARLNDTVGASSGVVEDDSSNVNLHLNSSDEITPIADGVHNIGDTCRNDLSIENLHCDNITLENIQLVEETSSDSEVRQKIEGIISCLNDLDGNENISVVEQVCRVESVEMVDKDHNLLASKESKNELRNKGSPRTLKRGSESGANLSCNKHIETSKYEKKIESCGKLDEVFLEALKKRIDWDKEKMWKNGKRTTAEGEDNESSDTSPSVISISTLGPSSSSVSESIRTKMKRKPSKRKFKTQLSRSTDTLSSSDEMFEMILPKESSNKTKKQFKFALEIDILNKLMKNKLAEPDTTILEKEKETDVTEINSDCEFVQEDRVQQAKSNCSGSTEIVLEKSMPVKMLTSKGVTRKKRPIEENSVSSNTSSSTSSQQDNLLVPEKYPKTKKLSILHKIPTVDNSSDPTRALKNAKPSKDTTALPRTLGWKVKSILSASEKDVPRALKKSSKTKRLNANCSLSPERCWAPVSFAESGDVECGIAPRIEYRPKSQGATTDFVIQPLTMKNQKTPQLPEYFSSNALDFKKKATFNDKIRREPSKELLKRKIRRTFYDKY